MAQKILLIEDDEIMVDLLERKISSEGYEVAVARDGEEGLKKIAEFLPDLILLDMVMPKKDGIEVLEEIYKTDDYKKIPLVVISNSGQPVDIERTKELGARDWLVKTEMDPKEVINIIRKHLPTN